MTRGKQKPQPSVKKTEGSSSAPAVVQVISERPDVLDRATKQLEQIGIRAEKTTISIETHESRMLPPPAELREYEELVPGISDRLVTIVEKQQAHSHNIDLKNVEFRDKEQDKGYRLRFRGQNCALVSTLTIFSWEGAANIWGGHKGFAYSAGVAVALVAVFMTGVVWRAWPQRKKNGNDKQG